MSEHVCLPPICFQRKTITLRPGEMFSCRPYLNTNTSVLTTPADITHDSRGLYAETLLCCLLNRILTFHVRYIKKGIAQLPLGIRRDLLFYEILRTDTTRTDIQIQVTQRNLQRNRLDIKPMVLNPIKCRRI